MQEEVYELKKKLSAVTLDAMYSPNTIPHQHIWAPDGEIVENAFVSDIGEENTKLLMKLNIENIYKVLLLLGIGTFKYHENKEYVEIMKELAEKQKLFMIIASTDYIYGTNYQFCHGFIGKDLLETTQQKLLQALGRIGRNNIQQDYTIRVRDNEIIKKLFTRQTYNLEAINMCKLLNNE
jgi:predicted MPP superfamily phosphohydrolase